MVDFTPISRYHPRTISPYSRVQPFTYRDGRTFIEVLSELRQFIEETVIPYIDDNVEALVDDFNEIVAAIIVELNETIDNVNALQALYQQLYENVQTIAAKVAEDASDASDAADIATQAALDALEAAEILEGVIDENGKLYPDVLPDDGLAAKISEDGPVKDALTASNVQAISEGGPVQDALNIQIMGPINARFPSADDKIMYVSPRGDDANDGLSIGQAKATAGAAIAAGATYIQCGSGTITEPVAWGTLPDNLTIRGAGSALTKFVPSHASDFASLGNAVTLDGLTIDGSAAPLLARGLLIQGSEGKQILTDVHVTGFDGPCIEFENQAGSQFRSVNLAANRRNAPTDSERFAVVIQDGSTSGAVPRSFVNFQSQGTPAISFGSCDNVYVVNSTVGDLRYTAQSRGVSIIGTRILNQMELTIRGHNNSILGGNSNPHIIIAEGSDNITVGPGSFNRGFTDNSKNPRNSVTHWMSSYEAILSTGGNAPSLGDGTMNAWSARSGATITANLSLDVGDTTDLGTGALEFSIPSSGAPLSPARTVIVGTAALNAGGTTRFAHVQRHHSSRVRLLNDDGSVVTGKNPDTTPAFTSGDTIRFSITYNV